MKNYIPFGRISLINMYGRGGVASDSDTRASDFSPYLSFTPLHDLSTGMSAKAHLQEFTAVMLPSFADLGLIPIEAEIANYLTPAFSNLSVRLGHSGRGMLTDGYVNMWNMYDSHFSAYSCWNLAYPYRIYPGQQLFAESFWGTNSQSATPLLWGQTPEWVAVHGRKVNDNVPYILYDGTRAWEENPAGAPGTLLAPPSYPKALNRHGNTLRCPEDSPVDLHIISAQGFRAPASYNSTLVAPLADYEPWWLWNLQGLQMFGPDGQPLWNNPKFPVSLLNSKFNPGAALYNYTMGSWILNPPTPWVRLGEGWDLNANDTFTAEFQIDPIVYSKADDASGIIAVVLRGSLEVDDGR